MDTFEHMRTGRGTAVEFRSRNGIADAQQQTHGLKTLIPVTLNRRAEQIGTSALDCALAFSLEWEFDACRLLEFVLSSVSSPAQVAELADALASGASALNGHGGSSPLLGNDNLCIKVHGTERP